MSDMLRLIENDLYLAKCSMDRGNDEVYLNYAGYHYSQAAEKLLKNYCLENGVIAPKIHKITELMNFMDNRGILNGEYNTLRRYSRDLDDWISQTRYVIAYLATRKQLLEVGDVLNSLYKMELEESSKEEYVEDLPKEE